MEQPSAEGKKRYPDSGIYKGPYWDEPHLWKACTCQPECPATCKGHCGCEACWESYRDSLAVA